MPRRKDARNAGQPCRQGCIDCRCRVMKMHNVGTSLFENMKEIPHRIEQIVAHARLYGEAFLLHLFAEGTKISDCIDRWRMPLFSLQIAELKDKRLRPAYLHAVHDMGNFHSSNLNL